MRKFVNATTVAALTLAQVGAAVPVAAQMVDDRRAPQVQQPVPLPAPVRPGTRPAIQPPRPRPEIQPPRPEQPRPPRPPIQIQPPRLGPIRPPYPDPGGNWQGGNWNGATIRCESQNYRYRECRADTRGGVRVTRVRGGRCVQGQSWGYRPGFVWVNNGCRADFQTRNFNGGGNNNGGGPSAGAVIGGVAIAAGLVALLANAGKKDQPQQGNAAPPQDQWQPPAGSTGAPARITANTGGVTPAARPSLDTCLTEAARQIGATGGTEIVLDRLDDIEQGNGGYRFRFQLKCVYPDETRSIPTFCRATPTTLVELTFG